MVFFLGDLNYRVSEGFDISEVYSVLELSDGTRMNEINSVLLEQDQLFIEKENKRAFEGFEEGAIGFKPTYQV